MTSCCLILFALLFPTQSDLATVSGEILDREGNPMVGALVTYTRSAYSRDTTRRAALHAV